MAENLVSRADVEWQPFCFRQKFVLRDSRVDRCMLWWRNHHLPNAIFQI